MKVALVGRAPPAFHRALERAQLLCVPRVADADVLIAYGGDGTFIGSEREHPGVPKLGIRREATCAKCELHGDDRVLQRLAAGELEPIRLTKLVATLGSERILALNDVILRNDDPRSAGRFSLLLDGSPITDEVIADGLVVCTPFGSSAYFRSITRTVIRTGIGVAFNNWTDLQHHLVLGESEDLEVQVRRGPLSLTADNDPRILSVADGARIQISRSPNDATVLAPDTLRCADCRYVHAPRRRF